STRAAQRPFPPTAFRYAHRWKQTPDSDILAAEERPMSYVKHVLQPGEQVRHTASIHWIVYWPGALMLILACLIYGYANAEGGGRFFWDVVAACIAIFAVLLLFREWFTWWTTEIAVTDRRIIFKEGFISRNTVEMHMDKVESVDVDQSILGRIFDYGDVIVKGTGTGFEPLTMISAPLELRNHITGVSGAETSMARSPRQLGKPSRIPSSPSKAELDRVANPHADTDYMARFTAPEFTTLCPITGQPDFAHLVIDYVPAKWLVESKSLKLYLASFRNHGAFHEDCTVAIGKKLVELLKPKWLRIGGYWYPRGGIAIDVVWQAGKLQRGVWVPDQGVAPYRGRG